MEVPAAIAMAVPKELAQKIVTYLATKPYAEVHLLINDLLQCKEAKDVRDD